MTSLKYFARWLDQLGATFQVPTGIEFSLECNPETVTAELLGVLKELGVNRPTFGIQSFNIRLLKLLNRKHQLGDSHRAIYLANTLGFDNYGVDMIFGLPKQTSAMFSADIDQLISLEPPHISFYQLTVEPGTNLARQVASGWLRLPGADAVHAMYRGGCERLAEAGYERYEVSSFAQPGYECRHNQAYWQGTDYLGLGPSAHSFMHGRRFANAANLSEYISKLNVGELPLVSDESGLTARMTEAIMLGLRTSRGIDRRQFSERFGCPVEDRLDPDQYQLLIESGHLIPDRGSLRLSEDGIDLADEITARLVK
jgi:oxygen-independent coproporphyrinogen-3 oxidase